MSLSLYLSPIYYQQSIQSILKFQIWFREIISNALLCKNAIIFLSSLHPLFYAQRIANAAWIFSLYRFYSVWVIRNVSTRKWNSHKKFIYQICVQYSSKDFIICSNFLWTPEISFYWDKAETFDVEQDNVLDSFWVLKYLQGRKLSCCLCRQFSISLNMLEIHIFWKKNDWYLYLQ